MVMGSFGIACGTGSRRLLDMGESIRDHMCDVLVGHAVDHLTAAPDRPQTTR
ncbi:hypothetical protein [Arthrobacter sp. NA-172]|uniref:hypothetical protein n=1 Tax=Arthrobacter sp. NA-172 TaxID=3367524 RepID=UPI0037542C72